jgi:hypothetical protein
VVDFARRRIQVRYSAALATPLYSSHLNLRDNNHNIAPQILPNPCVRDLASRRLHVDPGYWPGLPLFTKETVETSTETRAETQMLGDVFCQSSKSCLRPDNRLFPPLSVRYKFHYSLGLVLLMITPLLSSRRLLAARMKLDIRVGEKPPQASSPGITHLPSFSRHSIS